MDNETQQNATVNGELSATQEVALAALLAGRSVTDAADEAGVHRCTVHSWLRDDFEFQAALNRRKQELRNTVENRLMKLADKAVDCTEQAIESGHAGTALSVLRGLGLLDGKGPKIGSDDSKRLEFERMLDSF